MILTGIATLALVAVLLINLSKIVTTLDAIGGSPSSYLAKLRLGLRAIESETGHLAPQVTKLNSNLSDIGEGLKQVDIHLTKTINAVLKQEGS